MAVPPRKRLINPEQRRALQLLASSPYGATDDVLMLARGFTRRTLARLVRAELTTARRHAIKAGARMINRITITDAGRNAIEG
jgi:hypothetical protein